MAERRAGSRIGLVGAIGLLIAGGSAGWLAGVWQGLPAGHHPHSELAERKVKLGIASLRAYGLEGALLDLASDLRQLFEAPGRPLPAWRCQPGV